MEDIKLIKFGGEAQPSSVFLRELKLLVEECENLYPGIDLWFRKKVLPGFKDRDRKGYLIRIGERPVGATILRLGKDAKICSLRVVPEHQGMDLGELLFALAALELRGAARQVHFTAPTQLWEDKLSFFDKLGFEYKGLAGQQYRLFDQEISAGCEFTKFWKQILALLPGIGRSLSSPNEASRYSLIISMKPEYAKSIMAGSKRVEIRRRFSEKWTGSRAIVYSSSPERAFVGEIRLGKITSDTPEKIWENYRTEVGCDRKTFLKYCSGQESVSAIEISDVHQFAVPLLETQVEHLIQQDIKVPQSHCEIKLNSAWPAAVTLNHLLRASL
jgi:predicted transcriptional regulator